MEGNEGALPSVPGDKMIPIFSEFMIRVVKLEELANLGRRFLVGFQQGLEFLRRPPINNESKLVHSIIKANETKRLSSYVQHGCVNSHDRVTKLNELNTCLGGLQGHLRQARRLLDELESLMDDGSNLLQAEVGTSSNLCHLDNDRESEPKLTDSGCGKSASVLPMLEAPEYGSLMAVIYSMVKQDVVIQEKIVSSLNVKTPAGALETYCFMWSLRPFVNDDLIHLALSHVV